MKSLLRLIIFFVCLLFLPEPLLAVMFLEPLKVPLSVQSHQINNVGANWDGVDEMALNEIAFDETIVAKYVQSKKLLVAQVTDEKLREKKLNAQRSKDGLRIKKKKDFFKSKSPLPSVQMPTDWDGQVSSPPVKRRKTNTKTIRTQKPRKIIDQPDRSLKAVHFSRPNKLSKTEKRSNTVQLPVPPLPWLKPIGFDQKKQAQHLKKPPRQKKQIDALGGPVVKAALVVPPPVTVWKPKEIQQAQDVCQDVMKGINATVSPIKPIRLGVCGTPAPLKLKSVGADNSSTKIKIRPAATLNCRYTARFAKWATEKLQPLAIKHLNSPISMVHNVASYSCRHRYNDKKRKLSEHALANALDIAGFTLKDGRTVSILKHWDDEEEGFGAFLKAAHASACEEFIVVLGPEANEAHKNHFHFDMGRYKVCE